MRMLLPGLFALCFSVAAPAAEVEAGDAWLRAMPPGIDNTAAYMTLVNRGAEPRMLVGASSAQAGAVELHESRQIDGGWRMRPLQALPLPPGTPVALAPGGAHLMVIGVEAAPVPGDYFSLRLELDNGETIEVMAEVRRGPASGHHH